MIALPKVLLRDLQFGHLRCVLHLVEDGGIGFAWLEVERSVLRLQDDVLAELPVAGFELADGLHHAVFALVLSAIDERAPHDDATVRPQCVGQHVGTVGMRATVVERARLSLAVGFHEEAAEVGNEPVDFVGLALPPPLHTLVERVGCGQLAQCLRRTEVHREIDADAVGTQHVGHGLHLI